MIKKLRTRLPLVALTALTGTTLWLTACGGEDPLAGAQQAQSAQASGLPGPAKLLVTEVMSLKGLTAAQKVALNKLQADAQAQSRGWRSLHAQTLLEVAKQVRAGKIDKTALDVQMTRVHTAMQGKARPLAIKTLEALHQTLTPAQRSELVDRLQTRFRGHHRRGKHLRALMGTLGLSDDQKTQLRTMARQHFAGARGKWQARRQARRQKLAAAAAAFKSATFDAAKLDLLSGPPKDMKAKIGRLLDLVDKALPILSATQRDALATLIEQRAAKVTAGTVNH